MIHPKDEKSSNPRLQCSCCAKWMRLFGRDESGKRIQRFFGGCDYSDGDHLAGDKRDVCYECCKKFCKELKK